MICPREIYDAGSELGQALEVKQILPIDLLSIEVLDNPPAQQFLGVGVLPEPHRSDLAADLSDKIKGAFEDPLSSLETFGKAILDDVVSPLGAAGAAVCE